MPDKPNDPAIIKLECVRLSFPHLFTSHVMTDEKGNPQGEPKFGATFIMDNVKHAKLIAHLEKTIERMALDTFKKKVSFKTCLRDGNDKAHLDGYGDGVMFINAVSKMRRPVVDRQVNPLAEEDGVIYAGCYVNATIRLWVQDNKWGKRVNAELRAVQFVKDGESFGAGQVDAEAEFDSLDEKAEDVEL
jgi:Protein of unknown function (DUF2815)